MNDMKDLLCEKISGLLRNEVGEYFKVAWARAEMVDSVSCSEVYYEDDSGLVYFVHRSDEIDEAMYNLWEEEMEEDHDWAELTVRLPMKGEVSFTWNTEAASDGMLEGGDRVKIWRREHFGEVEILIRG